MAPRTALLTMALLAGLVAGPAVAAVPRPAAAPTVSSSAGSPAEAPVGRRLSNGCLSDQRGLPRCGAYLGASHGGNNEPTTLERRAGAPLGVRRTFFRGDQVSYAVDTARGDLRAGRLPWISFKLPLSWSDMAAGKGDAWTRDLAARLAGLPGPVWVAFHHEPEGDGDLDEWRRMQERLGPIVRATAPNVAFTVILTGWNQLFGKPAYALDRIWPRGVKVDVAGFDIYNEYGVSKHGSTIDEWPRLRTHYFKPLAAWARRHDVAWGLAETGITDQAFRQAPRWIWKTYKSLRAHGGVAFAYFDSALNTNASYELGSGLKSRRFADAVARGARLPRS